MNTKVQAVLIGSLLLCSAVLRAAPPMVAIEDRILAADMILVVEVEDVQLTDFNDVSKHAHLHLKTTEVMKGKDVPQDFNLAFLVFPETVENHLREPVASGKYIVFLNRKKVSHQSGHDNYTLVLLEPRLFAFVDYNTEVYNRISALLKAESHAKEVQQDQQATTGLCLEKSWKLFWACNNLKENISGELHENL